MVRVIKPQSISIYLSRRGSYDTTHALIYDLISSTFSNDGPINIMQIQYGPTMVILRPVKRSVIVLFIDTDQDSQSARYYGMLIQSNFILK